MKNDNRILMLRKAVDAMMRGRFARIIPTGSDEVGLLGKSLKKLSVFLKKQSDRNQSLCRIMTENTLDLQLADVLNHIFESFREHLPYDRVSLALLENNSRLKLHWVRSDYHDLKLNTGYCLPVTENNVQKIINTNELLIVNDLIVHLEKDAGFGFAEAILAEGIRSCLICPLLNAGKLVGFIFFSCRKKKIFKKSHGDLAHQITNQLAVTVEKIQLTKRVKLNKQLVAQKKSLEQRVTHDALTGLFNRPAILDILHKQIQRAKRCGFGISVIMIDIDYFKKINDTCGHLAGDAVLCEVTDRLIKSARAHEYIGRYGGEEFLAIVSPDDQGGAFAVAERFRDAVAGRSVKVGQALIPVTISLGVVIGSDKETLNEDVLLRCADAALYRAKHKGRNRVELGAGTN